MSEQETELSEEDTELSEDRKSVPQNVPIPQPRGKRRKKWLTKAYVDPSGPGLWNPAALSTLTKQKNTDLRHGLS